MKFLCFIFGHQWNGCECMRCHAQRDQGHQLDKTSASQPRCARCHPPLTVDHTWKTCTCTGCGATCHEWQHGICARCHVACPHDKTFLTWRICQNDETAYAAKFEQCQECDTTLAVLAKSAAYKLPSASLENEPAQNVCDPVRMASNPLWQEVRNFWEMVPIRFNSWMDVEKRLPEVLWTQGQETERPMPCRLHWEALEALVRLRELDADTAHGIQSALVESVYHFKRSLATCYIRLPASYKWRTDLGRQFRALREMAQRGQLDPKSVQIAQDCIAKDIVQLKNRGMYGFLTQSVHPMNHREAARIITVLLTLPGPSSGHPPLSGSSPAGASEA